MNYQDKDIKELKEYAIEENIPIMQDDGIEFLTNFIIKKQLKKYFRNRNSYWLLSYYDGKN